jgi:aminoglycoside phosphotransferase family enzyme
MNADLAAPLTRDTGLDRRELAAKLAFLRASNAFDGVREVIETHMSWVFLTDQHAFKLKKPVHLPLVDYRTLERRQRSCESELRLGRRLAPDVYKAVVPLVATQAGLSVGGSGQVVDWLVVMRRLPEERMLPQLLARREATEAHADALGELLARFYRTTPRAAWPTAEYRSRLRAQVSSAGEELIVRRAPQAIVTQLVHETVSAIAREARVLDARYADGRVVDAHGDLRPEHVCFEPLPIVIDPLEFDDDLRVLDAVSELAFFTLECDRLDASWFADRVVRRYLDCAGDQVSSAVLALFRRQHALTRALIALRHVDDARPGEQPRWRAKADDYLARATQ